MKLPIEIVTRGAVPPYFKESAREHAERLEHFYGDILRARVTLELRPRHPGPERAALRVSLTLPRGTIVVTREGGTLAEALRDGFDAATRRLEEFVRRRRGYVKAHTRASRGVPASVER